MFYIRCGLIIDVVRREEIVFMFEESGSVNFEMFIVRNVNLNDFEFELIFIFFKRSGILLEWDNLILFESFGII